MATARRRGDFNGDAATPPCILNEDAQHSTAFCIDVHSSHSLGELGYVTGKYNNRPSVIYFHESLKPKMGASENQVGSPKVLCKKSSSTNAGKMASVSEDIEDYTNEKQKLISQGLSDMQELEGDECRCKKRHRTSYSSLQLKRLEEAFDGDNYIIGMKRWHLSEELDIPEKQIKIWFQNRRTKSKKHCSKDQFCNSSKPNDYREEDL